MTLPPKLIYDKTLFRVWIENLYNDKERTLNFKLLKDLPDGSEVIVSGNDNGEIHVYTEQGE